MSKSSAETFGEWLVYIVIALAVALLIWKLDWSTLGWIAGGLVAVSLLIGFLLSKTK